MLNQTTISGLMMLSWLVLENKEDPVPPRVIAEKLGLSPTYAAKIGQQMTRAGILQTTRGTLGGLRLVRQPESVTLLEIIEACQGPALGDHCDSSGPTVAACAFHRAMSELHGAVVGVLERWTLGDLTAHCHQSANGAVTPETCRLHQVQQMLESMRNE